MENMIGTDRIIEYSELLKVYGMSYTPVGLYWQVGEIELTQGWILHVSATSFQLQPLLEKLIPALLDQKVPFRIVRDAILAGSLAEGGLGYAILGKMVSVYPENDRQAVALAKKLIELTAGYRGPAIPTDRHLGGAVYTRYGSFNPVMIKSPQGEWVKHIYNASGQLVADTYEIPFRVPEGQVWPFGEIADPGPPKTGKLMNYKYYPLLVMKPDAKGDVMKGLYFRKLWQIRSCIIKEGRANMFTDEYGRDIRDRLKWQYKLYKALHKDIPMPEVFDYFEIHDNVYLAMQFIKGQPLSTWYAGIYRDRSWHDLDSSQRLQLLDQLLRIISVIERMHQKGYVHRDITPENFLLDTKENIYLIDMELTWGGPEDFYQPPYKLGTAGHMSPEQQKGLTPTAKEDIYALGSIIATFLANIYALKITGQSGEQVRKGLDVLTGEPLIGALVAACWEVDPAKRPTLAYLTDQLHGYRENLSKGHPVRDAGIAPTGKPGNSVLKSTIQNGLNFLGAPVLLNQQHVWISVSKQKEVHIGNPQESIEIYEGWHTGMAGPLWLVARAKSMGFSIDGCRLPYISSWEFIDSHHFGDETAMSPGLYGGSAGIALALAEGMSSGLLEPNEGNRERLRACFASVARTPELSAGMAGQGLALLRCGPWLDKGWVGERLALYATSLMKMQQPDGGWNSFTDLSSGTAGILIFLLSFLQQRVDDSIASTVTRALNGLAKTRTYNGQHYGFPRNTREKRRRKLGAGHENFGVYLAFLKAYEVLGDTAYRKIAEDGLRALPDRPILIDLSLESGLTGLGELYLEAARVLQEPLWQRRADWIAHVLLTCTKNDHAGNSYWLTTQSEISTADLSNGNSGVLHYLVRYLYPDRINHPLL